MNADLPDSPKYHHTMRCLEQLRRRTSTGSEFWLAREIQPVLGYQSWAKFTPVIDRASASLTANAIVPSHHIVQADNMMGVGRSAKRRVVDFFLSRAACYLIAMNGDSSKPEIAAAQAYFTIQARRAELNEERSYDEKRLEFREKVTKSFKTVSGVAKDAGVTNQKQPIFHDARYQGLYGMSGRDLKAVKGLKASDNPFDYMGALELSANDFQMNLAAETIKKENVRGENLAIRKNKEIAQKIRQTMTESGSRPPEQLPVEEQIREIRKRIRVQNKIARSTNV